MTTKFIRRGIRLSALLVAGGLLTGTATLAQDASKTRKPFYCFAFINPGDGRGFEFAHSSIMLGSPDDKVDLQRAFYQAAKDAGSFNEYPRSDHSGCYFFDEPDQAAADRDKRYKGWREYGDTQIHEVGELRWNGGRLASPLPLGGKKATEPKRLNIAAESSDPPEQVQPKRSTAEAAREAELARTAAREAREAEFQARLAAHKARVAEYERQVAERDAEIARQQAQHARAQDAAAREKAAYEAKMAQHRRELEEANRRQQEYFAAQRRHALCLNGDKKMCDDIAAGKSALSDDREKQEASTDTDANRCVTTAEVRLNATFKGNTSASVMNGCGKPVDIRICLMTSSGWNCGIDSAVAPQAQGVHSSFNATGEVFVDARTTGSARAFANP